MNAAPGGFLGRMATASRARARAARAEEPEPRMLARALASPAPPPLRLRGFDLIAELKLRSPAAGALDGDGFDRGRQLEAYAGAGVACVSVLTEPDEFRGSLAHLAEAAEALRPRGLPVMRKDFLTDPYQVLEARAGGAGGVLVIVKMLGDEEIRALLAAARDTGLFALLEAFDAEDLERLAELAAAASAPPLLAGVNCRDLRSLRVEFARFERLAHCLPAGIPTVAESGITNPADARRVAELGYRLALVGSALMQAADPARAAAELVAAGRGAAAPDPAAREPRPGVR